MGQKPGFSNNTNAYLKNYLVGGCRGCKSESIPSDNIYSYDKLIILVCADPRRLCIPETTQGEAFQHNKFLRKEQKLSKECCRPYTPYATQGEAFQHNKFLRREQKLSGLTQRQRAILLAETLRERGNHGGIAPTNTLIWTVCVSPELSKECCRPYTLLTPGKMARVLSKKPGFFSLLGETLAKAPNFNRTAAIATY
ncbi:MAG: hypothetical protein F6J93_06715 [Oscillatoria sp. SIO1A7]|nr:hypothetical protein [Oscillatoria sp. SIO1A7]